MDKMDIGKKEGLIEVFSCVPGPLVDVGQRDFLAGFQAPSTK